MWMSGRLAAAGYRCCPKVLVFGGSSEAGGDTAGLKPTVQLTIVGFLFLLGPPLIPFGSRCGGNCSRRRMRVQAVLVRLLASAYGSAVDTYLVSPVLFGLLVLSCVLFCFDFSLFFFPASL